MNKKSLVIFSAILQLVTTPVFADDYGFEDEATIADQAEGALLTPTKPDPADSKTEEAEAEEVEPAYESGFFTLGAHYGTSALQDESAGLSLGAIRGSSHLNARLTLGANASDKDPAPAVTFSGSINNGRLWCTDANEKFCISPMLNVNGIYGENGNTNGANALTLNGIHRIKVGKKNADQLELTYGLGIGNAYVSEGRKSGDIDGRATTQDHRGGDASSSTYDTVSFWGVALNAGAYGKFINDKLTAGAEVSYFTRNGLFIDGVSEDAKVKKGAYIAGRLSYDITDALAAKLTIDVPLAKAKSIDGSSKSEWYDAAQIYGGIEYRPGKRSPAKAIEEDDSSDDEDELEDEILEY